MTAANYQACLAFTLKFEGGKSNDKHDPGGRTMEGVTQRVYDAYRRKVAKPVKTVFSMSHDERDSIYRTGYWDVVRGDALRAGEDLCLFDFAVNSGPARALGTWKVIGGKEKPVADMIYAICQHRLSFLHSLGNWRYFGAGWGRRVAACEAAALRMTHGHEAAPDELAKKATEVKAHADKVSTVSVAAGAGAIAGVGVAVTSAPVVGAIAAGACFAVAGVAAFKSWRHGQRVDAMTVEANR